MKKMNKFKKTIFASLLVFAMIFTTLAPSIESMAAVTVADSIEINDPIYNATTGVMKYAKADGYGSGIYKSIVISFTSVRTNNEKAVLPTSYTGFNYNTSLSNDATYVINMPDGKTLPEIATYIRRIEFVNCQNSSQKINFSIGKQEVKYKTSYCAATQHYYQFIPFTEASGSRTITLTDGTQVTCNYGTWQYAYYTALSMTYEGLQGYLVTITSADEDAFIYKNMAELGWIGATRMAHSGTSTTDLNGIRYYTSFDRTNANSLSYWYWASGPEASTTYDGSEGKFLSAKTGSFAQFEADYAKFGAYNNWNSYGKKVDNTEPNDSGSEMVATTLQFGGGYELGGYSGRVSTTDANYITPNDYVKTNPEGYSWNDKSDTSWATYGTVSQYDSKGFFIEFGDATTGLKEGTIMTNYEFKTTTKAITHNWEYNAETSTNQTVKDTIVAYCTLDNPKCSYYGSSTYHSTVVEANLTTPDMAKNGSAYSLATFSGGTELASATDGTLSDIEYYKVATSGATSGGTSLGKTAPTDVGYYYAKISITNGSSNAAAVSPFTIYDPDADYATEGINNKGQYDSAGNLLDSDAVAIKEIANGGAATSDLEVILASTADDVSLYKLAGYSWINGNTELSGPTWVSQVQKWVDASSTYSGIAKDPLTLSKESSSTWANFYKDLLKTESSNVIDGTDTATADRISVCTAGTDYSTVVVYDQNSKAYESTAVNATAPATDSQRYEYKYSNINAGIYAAIAKVDGSAKYAVTVAAITPQRTGPDSSYNIKTLFTVYIKESQATIDKTINKQKEDTLYIGESVDFDVSFDLPTYTARANALNTSNPEKTGYSLTFTDNMASGYTIDPSTIKLTYLDAANTTTGTEIFDASTGNITTAAAVSKITSNKVPTADNILYMTASTAPTTDQLKALNKYAASGTATPTATLLTSAAASDASSYQNTANMNSGDQANASLVGSYAVKRTASPIFDCITVTKSTSADENTTIVINFDEAALKAWEKGLANTPTKFVLSYKATVDTDIKINSEENYNKADIEYENNSTGTELKTIEDIVKGYTYGLKIVKIDGDSYGTSSQKYIAGAKFQLYQEIAAYKKDGSNYSFLGDVYKDTTDPLISTFKINTTTYATEQAQENQVIKEAQDSSDYYVLEQTVATTDNFTIASFDKTTVAVGSTEKTSAGNTPTNAAVTYNSGDTITRVYKKLILENGVMDSKGIITSVNTADGVTCPGLDTGSYILVETQAPIGYNELSEDMYFEINGLTKGEEQSQSGATLKNFREALASGTTLKAYTDDLAKATPTYSVATYNTTGLISLDVLNYAGLTLPSTGGIGILIFVAIGIAIMGTVIVLLIARRKKEATYM